MRRSVLGGVVVVALAFGTAAHASPDPPLTVARAQLAAALECPPAFTHPRHEPVLLVHGTGLNAEQSWSWNYGQALPREGFDSCSVTLPDSALGDIQLASEYVVFAIEQMSDRSRRKVDIITHSQGGMEARWAMRWWPAARGDVDDVVLLASPNHGIYAADACAASGNCWPAVWQMTHSSNFMAALNSVSEAPGRVSYTNVYSLTDELVEPSSTVPLTGGANVSNIAVQAICPGRVVHHAGLLEDAVAGAVTMDALTHRGPARRGRISATVCTRLLMPFVTPQGAASGNATLYGDAARAFAAHPGVSSEPPLAPYARAS